MAAYLDSYGARWHSPSYQAIICRLDNINIPESFGHRNVWDLHSCFPFLALFLLYALWLFLLRLFFLRVCWWSYSWVLACFKYRWPGESPPCVHICWISKEIGSSFHHDWSSRGMREFNCSARSKWTIWIFSFLFCSHNWPWLYLWHLTAFSRMLWCCYQWSSLPIHELVWKACHFSRTFLFVVAFYSTLDSIVKSSFFLYHCLLMSLQTLLSLWVGYAILIVVFLWISRLFESSWSAFVSLVLGLPVTIVEQ